MGLYRRLLCRIPGPSALAAFVSAAAIAAALTGCAPAAAPPPAKLVFSTDAATADANGVEKLDANVIIQQVLTAVDKTPGVHFAGTYSTPTPLGEDGQPVPDATDRARTVVVDLHGVGDRYRADLDTGHAKATLIRVGQTVYVTGDVGAATSFGVAEIADGFVSFRADDPRLTSWLVFSDVRGILANVLDTTTDGVTFARGATMKDPLPAVQLEVSSQGSLTGSVTVSTVGPPLPLALAVTDPTGQATFSFTEWGKEVSVRKPDSSTPAP